MAAVLIPNRVTSRSAPERDPAWLSRLFWISLGLVVLWPLGVTTEFKPWILLEPVNLKISAKFIASFWPLVANAEFLEMIARETWRTVAMAVGDATTARMTRQPTTSCVHCIVKAFCLEMNFHFGCRV